MKLSVIVPAFNAEKTLGKCLDSIIAQNMEDMEVIIVDDGSSDKTGSMADDYASRYSCFSVIHQQNKGLGAARNAGLLQSKGEYITFVDSDDYLFPHIYENQMVLLQLTPTIDVIEFSINFEGGKSKKDQQFMDVGYNDAMDYWVTSRGFRHCYACNKIFRRSVLENKDGSMVLFPEGKAFEDIAFMAKVFRNNPKIQTSSHIGYAYVYNPDGISASVTSDTLNDMCDAHEEIIKSLGIEFNKFSSDSLKRYYIEVLNRQLSARLLAGRPLTLHRCKVPLSKAETFSDKLKVLVLNALGLGTLVFLMQIYYSLTFKKQKVK